MKISFTHCYQLLTKCWAPTTMTLKNQTQNQSTLLSCRPGTSLPWGTQKELERPFGSPFSPIWTSPWPHSLTDGAIYELHSAGGKICGLPGALTFWKLSTGNLVRMGPREAEKGKEGVMHGGCAGHPEKLMQFLQVDDCRWPREAACVRSLDSGPDPCSLPHWPLENFFPFSGSHFPIS